MFAISLKACTSYVGRGIRYKLYLWIYVCIFLCEFLWHHSCQTDEFDYFVLPKTDLVEFSNLGKFTSYVLKFIIWGTKERQPFIHLINILYSRGWNGSRLKKKSWESHAMARMSKNNYFPSILDERVHGRQYTSCCCNIGVDLLSS